jgi:hypothetical protein
VLMVLVFSTNVVHQSHAQLMPDINVTIIHVNQTQEIVHNIDCAKLTNQFFAQTDHVYPTE